MKKFFVLYSLKQKLSPALYRTKAIVNKHINNNKTLKFLQFDSEDKAKNFIKQFALKTENTSNILTENDVKLLLESIVSKNQDTTQQITKKPNNKQNVSNNKPISKQALSSVNIAQKGRQEQWTILPNGHAFRKTPSQNKKESQYQQFYKQEKSSQLKIQKTTVKSSQILREQEKYDGSYSTLNKQNFNKNGEKKQFSQNKNNQIQSKQQIPQYAADFTKENKASNAKSQQVQEQEILSQQHTSEGLTQQGAFVNKKGQLTRQKGKRPSYWVVWNKKDLGYTKWGRKRVDLGLALFELQKDHGKQWVKEFIQVRKFRSKGQAMGQLQEIDREKQETLMRLKAEKLKEAANEMRTLQNRERKQCQQQHNERSQQKSQSRVVINEQQQQVQQLKEEQQPSTLSTKQQDKPNKQHKAQILLNYEDIHEVDYNSTDIQIEKNTQNYLQERGEFNNVKITQKDVQLKRKNQNILFNQISNSQAVTNRKSNIDLQQQQTLYQQIAIKPSTTLKIQQSIRKDTQTQTINYTHPMHKHKQAAQAMRTITLNYSGHPKEEKRQQSQLQQITTSKVQSYEQKQPQYEQVVINQKLYWAQSLLKQSQYVPTKRIIEQKIKSQSESKQMLVTENQKLSQKLKQPFKQPHQQFVNIEQQRQQNIQIIDSVKTKVQVKIQVQIQQALNQTKQQQESQYKNQPLKEISQQHQYQQQKQTKTQIKQQKRKQALNLTKKHKQQTKPCQYQQQPESSFIKIKEEKQSESSIVTKIKQEQQPQQLSISENTKPNQSIKPHPYNKLYILDRLINHLSQNNLQYHDNQQQTQVQLQHQEHQEDYAVYPSLMIKQSPGFAVASYQIKSTKTHKVIKTQSLNLGQYHKQQAHLLTLAFSLSSSFTYLNKNKKKLLINNNITSKNDSIDDQNTENKETKQALTNNTLKIHLNQQLKKILNRNYKLDHKMKETKQFLQTVERKCRSRVQYIC